MKTITISVSGEELETINVELTEEDVSALYKLRKEQAAKIVELEKKLSSTEESLKYSNADRTTVKDEISQAHTLLTALGIMEKTTEEEVYYRKTLSITTRIALYIAKARGAE